MPKVIPLSQAPIREALIEIRVDRRPDLAVDTLEAAHDRLKEQFPQKRAMQRQEFGVSLKEGKGQVSNVGASKYGFRFDSPDGKRIAQFQLDVFTLNWLAPYESWDKLYTLARRAWNIYLEVAAPVEVTQIGVRFINSLMLPKPVTDLEQYLTCPPRVPQKLPQGVKSFLSRVVVHDTTLGADCIITQAMEGADPKLDTIPIVLDIDTTLRCRIDPHDDFWEIIGKLRHLKNSAFFESVTDTTLEMYK